MKARSLCVLIPLMQLIVLVQSANDQIKTISVLGYGRVKKEESVDNNVVWNFKVQMDSDICPQTSGEEEVYSTAGQYQTISPLTINVDYDFNITVTEQTGNEPIAEYTAHTKGLNVEFDKTYLQALPIFENFEVADTVEESEYSAGLYKLNPKIDSYVKFKVKPQGTKYDCYSFALTALVTMVYLTL